MIDLLRKLGGFIVQAFLFAVWVNVLNWLVESWMFDVIRRQEIVRQMESDRAWWRVYSYVKGGK